MRGDSILKKIIYSSGFLAIVPAILILMFLHPLGTKYSLSVTSEGTHTGQYTYSDLNGDTISEAVYLGKGIPYYYISVKDNNSHFYDQWNLTDSTNPNISDIFFGDYDHDLKKEIYIFTYKGDSLFLNMNEMLDPHGKRMDRVYITQIGYLKGEVTSVLYPIGFFDENGDGKDELYFGITTGFIKDPRRVFSFDLDNRILKSSPFTGIICMNPKLQDVNGDGRPEIFGTFSACGNFGKLVPYSDSSTWFMVFNDRLQFEFPPVEFPGYVNGLETEGYKDESFRGYVLSHTAMGVDTSVLEPRIIIYTTDGREVRHRLYSDLGLHGYLQLIIVKSDKADKIYLLQNKFIELNNKLELIRTVDLPFTSDFTTYRFDINHDGSEEFVLYSDTEGKLMIYTSDLQKMAEVKFKAPGPLWKFSEYMSKDHEYKTYFSSADSGFFISMKRNNLRIFGFLVYPGIYLSVILFIILIKRINTLQVVQKESLNRRLVSLQLQGIKSQLDPHFTFNTLNSIASLIYLDDRELAYDYMNKFTQLLRNLINDAERIYRSLEEELEFVTTYLELEKLRFGDKFDYEINIGENVTRLEQVPKLVLHTFAENAIKHGIMSRREGGILKIDARRDHDNLVLAIEDNGIGRAKAAGQSKSTGRGLKLTGEFYDILNQINKKPIKHYIIDLFNENGASVGTRVEVWVPVEEG
jgi:two-component sensor histidine kinase